MVDRANIAVPLIAAAITLLLGGCARLGDDEASLILEDLAAGAKPSRLKAQTPAPVRTPIAYTVEARAYEADLYHPGSQPLAGIVLVPGVAQRGRHDPRLVAFASTMTRARFLVLVPDLPDLRELKVRPRDVQGVADAFSHLLSRKELPARARRGIGAFSYAVGPAVLAALRPKIRERVDFVLGVGGYHDLERVVTFFTTGYYLEEGEWRRRRPNRYGKWVFVLSNVDRLADAGDREAFRLMAARKLPKPRARVKDLQARLGPEGRALDALLRNRDPEKVPRLITRLPATIRADLGALTLANKDLSRLRAQLILVHGRKDRIIPYTESIALAAAVRPGQADLYLLKGLAHVDVRPKLADRETLWRIVQALLAQRGPVVTKVTKLSSNRAATLDR